MTGRGPAKEQTMRVAPCKSGFTLVDLLITLLLIGLFSMMAMPAFQDLAAGVKLDSATAELSSAIEYAGSLAVRYRRPFLVTIWRNRNRIRVIDSRFEHDLTNDHPDADPPVWKRGIVAHPVEKTRYVIDYDDIERFEGVDITAITGEEEIYFYPDGHCSTEATKIALAYGGGSRTVYIDGVTGRVTVQ